MACWPGDDAVSASTRFSLSQALESNANDSKHGGEKGKAMGDSLTGDEGADEAAYASEMIHGGAPAALKNSRCSSHQSSLEHPRSATRRLTKAPQPFHVPGMASQEKLHGAKRTHGITMSPMSNYTYTNWCPSLCMLD